jgi:hypothetical protein
MEIVPLRKKLVYLDKPLLGSGEIVLLQIAHWYDGGCNGGY